MFQENTPLVSVIISLHDSEKYIEETLESVVNQTYKNWEMIVVDDYSFDSSRDIVRKLQGKDNRITLVESKANFGGPARPRNIGLGLAKGKYIAFLDSDDVWIASKLEKQIEFMKDNATSGVGDWSAKLFYIDLSDVPSYTQNAEIATFINDKIENEVYDFDTKTVGTHSFGAEDPLEINFVYDESNYSFNYTVSQTTLTQDLGVKVFSPLIYQNDAGLWNHFGFNEINHMIALYSADYLTTPAEAVSYLNTTQKTLYPLITDVPAGVEDYITYSIFNRTRPYFRIAGVPSLENSIRSNPTGLYFSGIKRKW